MPETGIKLQTLAPVEVATPGTRVQVPALPPPFGALAVIVQALSTNEEPVVVGDKEVVAAAGSHATPTQRGIELAAKASVTIEINDTAQIWIDARKAKDGVAITALLA